MSTLSSQIATIELHIKALLEENAQLKAQHVALTTQLSSLQEDNKELTESLQLSEERNVALKTANAMLGSDDHKTKTKLKINALVREIDQCINQLAS